MSEKLHGYAGRRLQERNQESARVMERPSIFDGSPRTDGSPMTDSEGTYAFLNRVRGSFWDEIRRIVEEWYVRYPSDKGPVLASRIQSDEHGFWGAYFELFLHEILTCSDAKIDVDPELPGGRTPDFRVTHVQGSFLLEATTLMEPRSDEKTRRRIDQMVESLRKVRSADFMVSVRHVRLGPDQPAGTRLAAQLDKWLQNLDYAELRAIATAGSLSDMPTAALSHRGWEVTVRPIPKREDRRAMSSLSVMGPSKGRFVDDHSAMSADLREKARRYRSAGEPLVLAVTNRRWTADSEEIPLALFGAAWEQPRMMKALQIDRTWRDSPEGLWLTRSGTQYAEVVAVLAVENASPWSLADARLTVWHNPSQRFLDLSLPFDHVTVDRMTGRFKRTPAQRSIVEILELQDSWPEGEPFPRA